MRTEDQLDLIPKAQAPLPSDVRLLLWLFRRHQCRHTSEDHPQWLDSLAWGYHSAYEDPDAPKAQWGRRRVLRAIDQAEAAGLIVDYQGKYFLITEAGVQARGEIAPWDQMKRR